MSTIAPPRRLEELPAELLLRPLDFLAADHSRQRMVCDMAEELANGTTLDADLAAEILDYLKVRMAAHVLDEERDLFMLLRRRCLPDDEIDAILALLAGEHTADERQAKDIVTGLEGLIAGGVAADSDPGLNQALIDYARRQRRHLALENSIVLPMARVRLTARDLQGMAKRMAARRGVALPVKPLR